MIFLLFIVTVITTVLYIYEYLTRNFNYWTRRKVIGPKPVPIFGNIADIALCKLTQAECLQNIYRKYEGEKYVGMFQLSTPTLLLLDPQLIKQILVKDFHHFTDRGFAFDDKREPLTANLINLGGVTWRILRQKLTPAFSSGKIKNMMPLLHDCSDQLLDFVQETLKENTETEIELREFTAKFTTEVIGSCAFGLQFNAMSDEMSEFRRMGRKIFKSSKIIAVAKLVRIFFPNVFRLLKMRTFPAEVNDFFVSVVTDTLNHRQLHDIRRNDFLQMLAEIRNTSAIANSSADDEDSAVEFTSNLISAQAFAFFSAGFETTSTTLSFCLHELAVNEHFQNEVLQEIDETTQKYGQPLCYDSIKYLELLEMCLWETMRKYAPVQALARVCTKPYTIPNTSIVMDIGTAILVPVHAIHHDEKYYKNPGEFLPRRFTKENMTKQEAGIYMPFGDGPRICIGMRFAMLEMKLALATFLYKYKVGVCSKTKHPLPLDPASFILAPKGGIWLKVTKRIRVTNELQHEKLIE